MSDSYLSSLEITGGKDCDLPKPDLFVYGGAKINKNLCVKEDLIVKGNVNIDGILTFNGNIGGSGGPTVYTIVDDGTCVVHETVSGNLILTYNLYEASTPDNIEYLCEFSTFDLDPTIVDAHIDTFVSNTYGLVTSFPVGSQGAVEIKLPSQEENKIVINPPQATLFPKSLTYDGSTPQIAFHAGPKFAIKTLAPVKFTIPGSRQRKY